MTNNFSLHPVDETSANVLNDRGLRYGLVDTSDRESFAEWIQADSRGFHGAIMSQEQVDSTIAGVAYRRTVGVWDETLVEPQIPVATTSSWTEQLTVPGGRSIDAWAISSVTVSPTHRRRGIARALLEGELKSAAAMGLPLAMLTVSESTIYGRFGFGPAVFASALTIDAKRATFTSNQRPGRLQPVSPSDFRDKAPELFERIRTSTPGQIEIWPLRWEQIAGVAPGDEEHNKNTRIVRFDDEAGAPRGFVVYRVTGGSADFTKHKLTVDYLLAESSDAYEALWRFVLEVDLVHEVNSDLRSIDEPLLWHLTDRRAVTATPTDHLWLRILDVPAALQARRYEAPARICFDISDSLGFAHGTFLLEVDEAGAAHATPVDEVPSGAAAVALTINELSSLYLGGVAVDSLVASGRVRELTPGAALVLERTFHSPVAPWLSVWF
ncbi:GNAT family N-acetyltransferase [Salinibacterium sp. M195]|uniref:GNAT family N-acetyltransferase n=1 Tax=Salinibacterium sp. M195 TaxID=2583374 RepID=UPI001C625874|nr:GNAT family N-acetyltransferase [Salinibacterium sp. M195]QYH36215.1 GNAT family N-acetyltransferase [Salinibacterium sp. M195]